MAAYAAAGSDYDSGINQPGKVVFDINQETASQYQDKVSSIPFSRLDLDYGVRRKAKCTYQKVFPSSPSSAPNLARKIVLLY